MDTENHHVSFERTVGAVFSPKIQGLLNYLIDYAGGRHAERIYQAQESVINTDSAGQRLAGLYSVFDGPESAVTLKSWGIVPSIRKSSRIYKKRRVRTGENLLKGASGTAWRHTTVHPQLPVSVRLFQNRGKSGTISLESQVRKGRNLRVAEGGNDLIFVLFGLGRELFQKGVKSSSVWLQETGQLQGKKYTIGGLRVAMAIEVGNGPTVGSNLECSKKCRTQPESFETLTISEVLNETHRTLTSAMPWDGFLRSARSVRTHSISEGGAGGLAHWLAETIPMGWRSRGIFAKGDLFKRL
jgi:hypothetical protein